MSLKKYARYLRKRANRRGHKKKNAPVLVSVVVPVFNVEKYLDECMQSIFNQTYRHLEIVLVDDGSTDSSGALADDYGSQDARIQVVHQENRGLGGARNTGLDLSTGDYVIFLDSDDVLPPKAIANLYRAAKRGKGDFSIGRYQRFSGEMKKAVDPWIREACPEQMHGISPREFPEVTSHVPIPVKLFRRAFLVEHDLRFPEGIFYEDQLWMARAYTAANTISITPAVVYFYRRRKDESSISQGLEKVEVLIDACEQIKLNVDYYHEHAPILNYGYLNHVLIRLFPGVILRCYKVDNEHRELLADTTKYLLEQSSPEINVAVPYDSKVLLALSANRQWNLVERFDEYKEKYSKVPPSYPDENEIYTDFREYSDLSDVLPREATQWSRKDSRLVGTILDADWDEQNLDLAMYVYIRGLDMAIPSGEINAYLISNDGDRMISAVEIRRSVDRFHPDTYAGHRFKTYAGALASITFSTSDIASYISSTDNELRLEVELTQQGVTRKTVVTLVKGGVRKSMLAPLKYQPTELSGRQLNAELSPGEGLTIHSSIRAH